MAVLKKILALAVLVGAAVAVYGKCTAPGSNTPRETNSSTFYRYAKCFDHLTPDHFTASDDKQAIVTTAYRWPMGVIPYTIDASLGDDDKAALKAGMKLITDKTCLTFKKKGMTDLNWVKVQTTDGGCYSAGIGMRGRGEQVVNLENPGCTSASTAAHELLHAAGLYHEHARADRDKYIFVDYQNCCKENVHNYYRCNDTGNAMESCDNYGFAYNVKSIMHYTGLVTDPNFAVDTTKPIMISRNESNPIPDDDNDQITKEDAGKINYIYRKCKGVPR